MQETVQSTMKLNGNVSCEDVFAVIKNIREYPQFMKDVVSVEVTEEGTGGSISRWQVNIDGCPLNWTSKDMFRDEEFVYEYELIHGDFDTFDGKWTVRKIENGAEVDFSITYQLGIPTIEEVLAPILRSKLEKNLEHMLEGIKVALRAKQQQVQIEQPNQKEC